MERGPRRDAQWWLVDEGRQPHHAIDSIIATIRTQQGARYEAYRRWATAYGANISALGLSPSYRPFFNEEIRVNEMANVVDTLVAQVFKNRIVPSPHTVGGDWIQRKRCERLGRWLDGTYDECSVFDDAVPKAGLASFLFGTGPIKVSSEVVDEEKKLARLVIDYAPTQLCYVDEIEGRFGKPPCFYQEHTVDRFWALDNFAAADDDDPDLWGTREEREKAILDATHTANDTSSYAFSQEGDQIVIRECWRLPTLHSKGAHCISINSATLSFSEYKRKRFPFAFIRHGIALGDFWGQSLVQRLEPSQKALDRLDEKVDAAHAMMAIARIILGKNSGIAVEHIDDIPFGILMANDINGIKEWNAQPVHPDTYAYRSQLSTNMRGLAGVNAYSTQGAIPAGLKNASGKALEAFEDAENARHSMLHRSYEAAMIDLAEIIIDECEELEARGYTVLSCAKNKNEIEPLKFKDVRMDREDYRLRIPPISQLAKSFSSRLEQVETLANNQWIRPTTARTMLGNPDVEAENEIDTADDDVILQNFHKMIDDGEPSTPLATDNLGRIVELSGKFINWCRLRKVPSERWALIAQYADEAIRLQQMASPPAPPAAPPMPEAVPPAAPLTPDPMAAPPMPPGPLPMGTA